MAAGHWYFARGKEQIGPMDVPQLAQMVAREPNRDCTLVFGPGMTAWAEARQVPQIAAALGGSAPLNYASPPPPPMPGRVADVIDYEIFGEEMQYAEITLDPGEMVTAEPGAMMYMTAGIKMDTSFGDPSVQQQGGGSGFLGKVMTAGKRMLTGESLFITTFTNVAQSGREKVAFAAPFPGKIVPLDISKLGGEMICQKNSFLCAARGVSIGIAFQKKLGVGFFGGEGFIMQRLTGAGIALVHAGGSLMQRTLAAGETLRLDTGCLVALTPSVNYDIQFVGGFKNTLFGGEGLFFATLTGPP